MKEESIVRKVKIVESKTKGSTKNVNNVPKIEAEPTRARMYGVVKMNMEMNVEM